MKQEHTPKKKTKGTVISSTTEEGGLLAFYETHQSRDIGRLLYGTCILVFARRTPGCDI